MRIVLLSGNPSSGKTTTMNLIYNDLLAKGAKVVAPRKQVGGNKHDFECVLEYKGELVAIFSMGDSLYECYSAIVKYAYCNKLIMAYSNRFAHNLATDVGNCPHHKVVFKSHGNAAINNPKDAVMVVSNI